MFTVTDLTHTHCSVAAVFTARRYASAVYAVVVCLAAWRSGSVIGLDQRG